MVLASDRFYKIPVSQEGETKHDPEWGIPGVLKHLGLPGEQIPETIKMELQDLIYDIAKTEYDMDLEIEAVTPLIKVVP